MTLAACTNHGQGCWPWSCLHVLTMVRAGDHDPRVYALTKVKTSDPGNEYLSRAWTRLPFLHGSNIPSPTAQTLLCAPYKPQPVCPGLGIYEPSESKASGLGSLIKNYPSPWPGLGSYIYTLSGAESWPWINSHLASNHFAPGPSSYINSSSGANTIISINWPPQFSIPKRKQLKFIL